MIFIAVGDQGWKVFKVQKINEKKNENWENNLQDQRRRHENTIFDTEFLRRTTLAKHSSHDSFKKQGFSSFEPLFKQTRFFIFFIKTSNPPKSMKFSSLDKTVAPNERSHQKPRIFEIIF